MSFIKNKFRALYMAAFIIFTVIFTIMMPDGHTAMWFAMLTALDDPESEVEIQLTQREHKAG